VTTRTRTIKTPEITRDAIEALSAARNEPDWLRERRLEAWAIYSEMPMPTLQIEEWRRSDYTTIRWDQASALQTGSAAGVDAIPADNLAPLIGGLQGGLIAAVDGRIVHNEVSEAISKQGVIFTDLQTAIENHGDLVRKHLMTSAVLNTDGKFAALHGAAWTHGIFLYVPRRKVVELPLHSVFYSTTSGLTAGHVLVVAEEGAQVTFLHEYLSAPGIDAHMANVGATELIVGAGANVKYVALQNYGRNVYDIRHERARIGANGQLDWIVGTMGGHFVKQFAEIELDGAAAFGRNSGLFFADTNQFFDHDTQQNHNAEHTTSDLLYKGALKDQSRTVWQGMIKVAPGAQKTDGFQANRNLMLSEEARADSIPGLEIEADDVRCTHAATVGKLDHDPVFYLISRGIPYQEAERLLVLGYFDPIMQRIPFEEVRERLTAHIEEKLARAPQMA
jgi:Fe-S cluster assembly protein SufD